MEPFIDHIVEPNFQKLAPELGGSASPRFLRAQTQFLTLEIVATAMIYVIVAIWVIL